MNRFRRDSEARIPDNPKGCFLAGSSAARKSLGRFPSGTGFPESFERAGSHSAFHLCSLPDSAKPSPAFPVW